MQTLTQSQFVFPICLFLQVGFRVVTHLRLLLLIKPSAVKKKQKTLFSTSAIITVRLLS